MVVQRVSQRCNYPPCLLTADCEDACTVLEPECFVYTRLRLIRAELSETKPQRATAQVGCREDAMISHHESISQEAAYLTLSSIFVEACTAYG